MMANTDIVVDNHITSKSQRSPLTGDIDFTVTIEGLEFEFHHLDRASYDTFCIALRKAYWSGFDTAYDGGKYGKH
jgi:hypothetical protein